MRSRWARRYSARRSALALRAARRGPRDARFLFSAGRRGERRQSPHDRGWRARRPARRPHLRPSSIHRTRARQDRRPRRRVLRIGRPIHADDHRQRRTRCDAARLGRPDRCRRTHRDDAADDRQPRDRAQGSRRLHGRQVRIRDDLQRHPRSRDLQGTVRCFDADMRAAIPARMGRISRPCRGDARRIYARLPVLVSADGQRQRP